MACPRSWEISANKAEVKACDVLTTAFRLPHVNRGMWSFVYSDSGRATCSLNRRLTMSNSGVACCLVAALIAATGQSRGAALSTEYTPTKGRACVTISNNHETGDTVKRCPGAAGFSVLVLNSDDRASISLIAPDGKVTLPLDFWDIVTPSFSTLGPKVEWQLESIQGKKRPVSIIVRVHTVDQTDVEAPRPLSYFVVAAIAKDSACVIGKIPAAQVAANESARALAKARGSNCMPRIH